MNMKTRPEALCLEHAIKALWGATAMPFSSQCSRPFQTPEREGIRENIEQLIGLRTCGILCGPNGVGKSYLTGQLMGALPEKAWRIHALFHSSLTGTDLLRALCRQAGLEPRMRKSDNVAALTQHWENLRPIQALLVIEEAQNLSTAALEEIRLLSCARRDTASPFSLLMVGDESFPARLRMAIHRPLLDRIGYQFSLKALTQEQSRQYLQARLEGVGIHAEIFAPAAEQLVLSAAEGVPRHLNHLAQRSLESAAKAQSSTIDPEHVQQALAQLPWLAPLASSLNAN